MRPRLQLAFFVLVHLSVLLVVFTGVRWYDVLLCAALYAVRMFGITAGYHRLLSHRGFKASRPVQFAFAFLGAASAQKGPIWWAAIHRVHHRYSDRPQDPHSPIVHGLWEAHVGWVIRSDHEKPDLSVVRDLTALPELRWLDRYHLVAPLAVALLGFAIDGFRGVIWGFSISTVLLWHATFCINSLAHLWGTRRYRTRDGSRNNLLLALLTFGEGWHNNHHHFAASARQGFRWWEIDLSYYGLKLMSALHLVSELRQPPARVIRPTNEEEEPAADLGALRPREAD